MVLYPFIKAYMTFNSCSPHVGPGFETEDGHARFGVLLLLRQGSAIILNYRQISSAKPTKREEGYLLIEVLHQLK